ncbi:hypothetical protein NTGZN8_100003 [Candidatus Nitrotoga fabula]|uniref:Uncharacterized protein n=1 Tax=Candidatus Nitrotoga fabula TaxID=2182327 RepID=A0A916BAB4_9PROT|nr:hypothetical protein NTGZN8_100003 [Candidatus Nitrotoga fabula]
MAGYQYPFGPLDEYVDMVEINFDKYFGLDYGESEFANVDRILMVLSNS